VRAGITARIAFGLALGLALVLAASPARASSCGKPDLVDMVPPDGATDVPPNATLAAHYVSSADYLGEDVVLDTPDLVSNALPATFDATEGRLSITPPDPLVAGGKYTVHWPALRGLNAAAPGVGGQATFTVASLPDSAPPAFEGVAGVSWDLQRENNDCTNTIEPRFVFDIDLGAASDDGGRDNLTLILFQTMGGAVDGGSVPVLAAALPPAGTRPRVALPVPDATGHVCFAGLVRDTTGAVSNSADRQACVDTTPPPFFRGCAVAPAGGSPATAVVTLALVLLAGARSRGRRRS
jgi:MYXO-CTERM domain-containing protein